MWTLNKSLEEIMKLHPIFGLTLAIALVIWAILQEMSNPMVFLNLHGIAIVAGGTLCVAIIIFSFKNLINLSKVLFRTIRGDIQKENQQLIQVMAEISEKNHKGERPQASEKFKKPFFLEAISLLNDETLSLEDLESVLMKRLDVQHELYRKENNSFKLLSKFPPAFGLIGATMGMIALLQGLGGEDSINKLGPAMSVALTATFWGLFLTNFILLPLGENLCHASDLDLRQRRIIMDGVLLIRQKKHPIVVKEFLQSYLAPGDRFKEAA
jgi:chemotaxis protein MotA